MRAGFFLGCTIPVRAQNFEMSTRRVAEALDLELVDLPSTGCCGYPTRSLDQRQALTVAAAALADAEAVSPELVTICTACTGVLTEAAHVLNRDESLREEVNAELGAIGKRYEGTVRVRHFARLLTEVVGEEAIRAKVSVDLGGLRFAPHYGCHYLRPSAVYEEFDSVENPRSLDRLIELTGAKSVRHRGFRDCCGGACLAVDEGLALSIAKTKLDALRARGVDAMVLVCPFCSVMYDSSQKKIEAEHKISYGLPVLYLPQVLGLAFGLDPKAMGFQMNRVKAKDLLARIPQPA